MTATHDEGHLDVEERFATVPEWLLRAPISDRAKTLYAVIQRYGNTSGARMPGRAELASWLNNTSKSSISRAIAELEEVGALRVTRSFAPGAPAVNRYYLRTTAPVALRGRGPHVDDVHTDQATAVTEPGKSTSARKAASGLSRDGGQPGHAAPEPGHPAMPTPSSTPPPPPAELDVLADANTEDGRPHVAYRSATGALRRPPVRHNRENNQIPPPTPSPFQTEEGDPSPIDELDELDELLGEPVVALVEDCRRIRTSRGMPIGAWTVPKALRAIADAVAEYEPAAIPAALRALAADPQTAVPGRLKGAGPWWNTQTPTTRSRTSCGSCDHGWLPADPSDADARPVRCSTCHPAERAS